jgi:lipopolysaccharide export system permease protein
VVVANEGQVTADSNGLQWLTLKDGSRYEGHFTGKQFQVSEFREYSLVIRQQEMERSNRKAAAKPTLALLGTQDNQLMANCSGACRCPSASGALTFWWCRWRGSIPVRALRQAAAGHPALSFLFLLLSAARSAIDSGRLPHWPGMFWCPGLSASDRVASQPAGHQLVERGQRTVFKRVSMMLQLGSLC